MADQVKVSFVYTPEEDARDPEHEMGITEEEHDRLLNLLMPLGAEDMEVERA